jgi:hypothetical protein
MVIYLFNYVSIYGNLINLVNFSFSWFRFVLLFHFLVIIYPFYIREDGCYFKFI